MLAALVLNLAGSLIAHAAAPAGAALPADPSRGCEIMCLASVPDDWRPPVADVADGAITVLSGFEGSQALDVRQIGRDRFVLAPRDGIELKYLLFQVRGGAGRTVQFDIAGIPASTWSGVNPVCWDAGLKDLADPPGFMSGTSWQIAQRPAHNGPLLPDDPPCLWKYLPEVWREGERLCFSHRFESDGAFVALRVPYLSGYLERVCDGLAASATKQVEVVNIGRSKSGRPLRLIRIGGGGGGDDSKTRPCVLIFAREHGTEPDASWVAQGALEFLLSDDEQAAELRKRFTFLIVPLLDPDGAAEAIYDNITMSFVAGRPSPEAVAYAAWFQRWIQEGHRLDVVLNLHNPSPGHRWQLTCFEVETQRIALGQALHACISAQLTTRGMLVEQKPYRLGVASGRLGWWLRSCFGSLMLHYEINSQNPTAHLGLSGLREMGRLIVIGAAQFLDSADGRSLLADVDRQLTERQARWRQRGGDPALALSTRSALEAELVVRAAGLNGQRVGKAE